MAAANIMPAAKGLRSGVGFWLLAADRGGWRCLAIASAVWDNVGGQCSQQRHRGIAGLATAAAGCSTLLGDSGAVHHRKMAQPITWLAALAAEAVSVGGAKR